MEFWGVEVKAGETVKCEPGEDRLLHLSQAALGETKSKGAENVLIYVKFNDQKLLLGTLSAEKCAQISYDLVFEKEFELSHGSKIASVYFAGYKTDLPEDDEFPSDIDESDSEEDVPVAPNANGALKVKTQEEKPAKLKSNFDKEDNAVAKSKAKAGKLIKAEPKAGNEDDSEDDDDYEGSDDDVDVMEAMGDSDDDVDSDEDDESSEEDDDEDDESSEEEDEETPKKSANGKKRPAESASRTSALEKKAKLATSASGQKTGGDEKKGTPAKQPGKAQANSDKPKQHTPKSAGSVSCKSCSKLFNSEIAREAHTKAKHSGAK